MRSKFQINTLDTHTEGEPTRIVLGGPEVLSLGKGTVREKRDRFKQDHDWIRKLLMKEPRGHDDMFGAVIVPSENRDADLGAFYMENEGYLDMCGHGTIGVVTALIETRRLRRKTSINIETPAGMITAWPEVDNEGVEAVTIQNVDSFVFGSAHVNLQTPEGPLDVPADIVYSGNTIAMVDSSYLNLSLERKNITALITYGLEIKDKLNSKTILTATENEEKTEVDIIEFYETRAGRPDRDVVVFGKGSVDRSPCGTGTCAKMTYLYEQGNLKVNERYEYEGILGTSFEGQIVGVRESQDKSLIQSQVTGSAYITGEHTFSLDPDDPVVGFSISKGEGTD